MAGLGCWRPALAPLEIVASYCLRPSSANKPLRSQVPGTLPIAFGFPNLGDDQAALCGQGAIPGKPLAAAQPLAAHPLAKTQRGLGHLPR